MLFPWMINVREYRRSNTKEQSRETGSIVYTRHRTNKCWRIPKGNKKDNLETLATLGAHEEDKRNKNTTQYVLDITMRKQTHVT